MNTAEEDDLYAQAEDFYLAFLPPGGEMYAAYYLCRRYHLWKIVLKRFSAAAEKIENEFLLIVFTLHENYFVLIQSPYLAGCAAEILLVLYLSGKRKGGKVIMNFSRAE